MVPAYALTGCGNPLQNARGDGLVGNVKEHKNMKLDMLHAAYGNIYRHRREDLYSGFLGVGAFVLPLVATYFSYKRHWSYHFAHHPHWHRGLEHGRLCIGIRAYSFHYQERSFTLFRRFAPGSYVPDTCRYAERILPARLLTESVGWINGIVDRDRRSCLLIMALLASRYGIGSLQAL